MKINKKPLMQSFGKEVSIHCKGLNYRAYNQVYLIEGKVEQKRGYSLLKKLSCKPSECPRCESVLDMLNDDISNNDCLGNIENGAIYSIVIEDKSVNTLDGMEYDYEIFFKKKENK